MLAGDKGKEITIMNYCKWRDLKNFNNYVISFGYGLKSFDKERHHNFIELNGFNQLSRYNGGNSGKLLGLKKLEKDWSYVTPTGRTENLHKGQSYDWAECSPGLEWPQYEAGFGWAWFRNSVSGKVCIVYQTIHSYDDLLPVVQEWTKKFVCQAIVLDAADSWYENATLVILAKSDETILLPL